MAERIEKRRTVILTFAVLDTTFPDEGSLGRYVRDAVVAWNRDTDYPRLVAVDDKKDGPAWTT